MSIALIVLAFIVANENIKITGDDTGQIMRTALRCQALTVAACITGVVLLQLI